jgi:hypothetical protein
VIPYTGYDVAVRKYPNNDTISRKSLHIFGVFALNDQNGFATKLKKKENK